MSLHTLATVTLHFTVSTPLTASHCSALHCTALHCTALLCTALLCSTLLSLHVAYLFLMLITSIQYSFNSQHLTIACPSNGLVTFLYPMSSSTCFHHLLNHFMCHLTALLCHCVRRIPQIARWKEISPKL